MIAELRINLICQFLTVNDGSKSCSIEKREGKVKTKEQRKISKRGHGHTKKKKDTAQRSENRLQLPGKRTQ